jgi:hypothetical protein
MEDNMKKTRHEGNEGTVAFWLYMKALYKDEEQQQHTQDKKYYGTTTG